MPSQYDPLEVDYDPFAAGAYARYEQPPARVETVQPVGAVTPVAAPSLQPFEAFMAGRVDAAKAYAEYVGSVLPRYMSGLGLTPEQQASELTLFKAQRPAPKVPSALDTAFERFDTAAGKVLPTNAAGRIVNPAGMAAAQTTQAAEAAQIEQRRKELGVADAGWFKSAWDAMASGLANAYGSTAQYAGRRLGVQWLETSGAEAQREAAALMKADPEFKDKLFAGGGSALGYLTTAVVPGVGAAALGAGVASRVALGAAVSGLAEGAGVAQETYETAMRNTGNAEQAEDQAFKALLLNTPVSALMNKIAFFNVGGNVVGTLARGFLTNSAEEGVQTLLTNYLGFEENVAKGLAESMVLGGLVGGPVSLLMHRGSKAAQQENPEAAEIAAEAPTEDDLNKQLDGIVAADEEVAPTEVKLAVPAAPAATTANLDPDAVSDVVQRMDEPLSPRQPGEQDEVSTSRPAPRQSPAQESAAGGPASGQSPAQESAAGGPTPGQGASAAVSPASAAPAQAQVGVSDEAIQEALQGQGDQAAGVERAQGQSGVQAVQEEGQVAPTLPKDLAGAKPRYKTARLTFASDVDRALYIVGRSKKLSASDGDYVTWLKADVFPGETTNQIRGRGALVADSIKASFTDGAKDFRVPAYYAPGVTVAGETLDAATQSELQAELQVELDALQIPDVPTLAAAEADAMIARLKDEAELEPNASQKAAFVAAESVSDGRAQSDQPAAPAAKRTRKPRAARYVAKTDPGVQAVQLDLPGQSSEPGAGAGGDAAVNPRDVAAGRAEALTDSEAVVDTRRPMDEGRVKRLWEEMSTLDHPDAKVLADYFYKEYDQGFGAPLVDMAKVARARAVHAEVREAKKLRRQGIDDATIERLVDPGTGENYDSRALVDHFTEEKLPAPAIQALLDNNLRGALEHLYLHGSTPIIRAVAGRLADVNLSKVQVQVAKLGKDDKGWNVRGRWKQGSLVLQLDGVLGMNEHTLLHEATHAATVTALINAQTKEQQAAVRELESIYHRARAVMGPDQYGFTDLAEFVAEALSDPAFQAQLYQIKERQSLWQRFIGAVTRLVGLDNLLNRTMHVAEALMMAPVMSGSQTFNVTAKDIPVERTGTFYAWVFDSQAPVLHMGKQIERALAVIGVKIPESLNLRIHNTLKRSQAEAALRKWSEQHWDKIVGDTRKITAVHGRKVEHVEKFLEQLQVLGRAQTKLEELDPTNASYPQHSAELQVDIAEANEYLLTLETGSPAFFRDMITLAGKIKSSTDATLAQRLAARNNMTSQRLAALRASFPSRYMPNGFYIPLQLDEHDGMEVTMLKQSLGKNFKADKPLARIYAQAALTAYSNEANAEKQKILALARLYNLVDAHTGKTLVEVAPVSKLVRDKHTGEITEGIDTMLLDADSVGVWVDGAFVKMRIRDPALREALRPIQAGNTPQAIGTFLGVARHFNQLMSAVRTSLNPGFSIFNYLRDTAAVAVQLDPRVSYASFVAAAPGAMYSAFKNVFAEAFGGKSDAKFRKALDTGAFISQRSYIGLIDTIHDVQQDLAPTVGKRLKALATDPLGTPLGKVLGAFTQALETATRLAIYDAAIASRLSPKEAAYIAKTTTVNFERKSKLTNAVGPFYMFVNAKAQGIKTFGDKLVGIDANPRTQGAVGAMLALGLIAAMIGYEESEKDKDGISKYFKIADYKRDRLLVFKEGSVGVPLPQEASLFYILGNAIGDVVYGPSSPTEALARVLKNVVQQLSPLGAAQTDPVSSKTDMADYVMRLFLPTAAQPAYDLATNKDTFGRPIVSESLRFRGKKDFEKYTRNENVNSIAAAKAMYEGGYADVSPATLTYWAKYLEGGAVTFWRNLFEPPKPTFEGQVTGPLARRFSTEAAPYGDEVAYRDALAELETIALKVKQASNMTERGKVFQANRAELALLNQFKAFEELKSRSLFRGYGEMSEAQYDRASAQARERTMALMRQFYTMKGTLQ